MDRQIKHPLERRSKSVTLCTALIVTIGLAIVASGCTRTSNLNQGGTIQPAPVTPAPRPTVQSGQLTPAKPTAPPAPTVQAQRPDTSTAKPVEPVAVEKPAPLPETPKPVDVASSSSSSSSSNLPVSRNAVIGTWKVRTAGKTCEVFLSLTKWSGGYRAGSKGCPANAVSVQAWDVRGQQIVLIDSSGSTSAQLYRSAKERYDGSTSSGKAISFYRES